MHIHDQEIVQFRFRKRAAKIQTAGGFDSKTLPGNDVSDRVPEERIGANMQNRSGLGNMHGNSDSK